MEEKIRLIALRLGAMREIRGFSLENMANKTGVTLEEYAAYERGEKDFSFSFLFNCASALDMDVSELMTGLESKLACCTVVRQGEGVDFVRSADYSYKHLATHFKHRKAEPFLVTVKREADSKVRVGSTHESQEFIYVIEGAIKLNIGGVEETLFSGDSAYFDSTVAHYFSTYECETARFLTLVVK